jgi:CsbD-like
LLKRKFCAGEANNPNQGSQREAGFVGLPHREELSRDGGARSALLGAEMPQQGNLTDGSRLDHDLNEEERHGLESVEGNWKQVKGKVKEQWGKLTDDDLDVINGSRINSRAGCNSAMARQGSGGKGSKRLVRSPDMAMAPLNE